ncbi:SpoIIE family protein phosphatase [Streptomyces sp. NBC_00094]|uniref:ATP-binding SpoIIE family protein phosphatase n=1 Tax=Streptomyces sp. NBC_00094 TaxID=2903620 RepID=UPI00224D2FB3|nr:SpoIIE family protein phosphatase [Streptomyces sp. NBC_00094]MCX5394330.1 SpoIIE family protein phosphatase [Streptomyces sp. NBC_00094]
MTSASCLVQPSGSARAPRVCRAYIAVVESDVDVILSKAARGVVSRAAELADQLSQLLSVKVPELTEYEDIVTLGGASIADNIAVWGDALENGLDLTRVEAPLSFVEYARRFAREGGRISTLLRTYRYGQAGLLRAMLAEMNRLTKDPELINAATVKLSGMILSFIDRTSEQAVAAYQEERDRWVQRRLSLVNEANVRVGTTLDIAGTADELAAVGTDYFADLVAVDLLDSALLERDAEPAPGPPTLHRVAQRSVWEGCPDSVVKTGQSYICPEGSEPAQVLATGQPWRRRLDGSKPPAWLTQSPDHRAVVAEYGIHSVLVLPLQARGKTLGLAQFFRHRTAASFSDDDLLLAQEITKRTAVYIDNARRYTHERSTALTLQRSLLQRHPPEQSAVEVASRYQPAGSHAGVGGDWYDVIPLSGARVALVVGDVIGHGIHASATMGRLRMAVRTLADVDLPPDELLTHLDDVVVRLQQEESPAEDEISATCLYAVYDPVSRVCSLASAGHAPPRVVLPAVAGSAPAAAAPPDLPIGPPLGLGGLPFETVELELPEGSLLALYTDGLTEHRSRTTGDEIDVLSHALTQPATSLERVCDTVLGALLPDLPQDDVALLLARTRALDVGRVAAWDIPSDPAAVAGARRNASEQLAAWGLEECAFITELIVSELVTNAIRYGRPPVRLRLIHDRSLVCEVSDASSTAPHLRRARLFDEGGRGLMLVAQLAQRWGTRHGREGKIIWTEQDLPRR